MGTGGGGIISGSSVTSSSVMPKSSKTESAAGTEEVSGIYVRVSSSLESTGISLGGSDSGSSKSSKGELSIISSAPS